jgi:predicted Rossmann fold nucleotide-binding protein DprA/Smf involved in DNA uptake
MTLFHPLSPDTQTTLLLCATLGQRSSEVALLSPTEYHALAQWLFTHDLRPGDLLTPEGIEQADKDAEIPIDPHRLHGLLARGAALALAVEKWNSQGLWVLSRADAAYPRRLKSRLGRTTPPLLFGAGDVTVLERGGLGIVGSRDINDDALAFTQLAARTAVTQGLPVLSGGARGVDRTAMMEAIENDGFVVGVLADSLAKEAVSSKYRQAIRDGTLTLCTPYDPSAGFNVGHAMGRNRIIYALSDIALVVSATLEKGGTWVGAVENLRHQWVPLLVWDSPSAPKGNQALLEKGATALTTEQLQNEQPLLELAKNGRVVQPEAVQLTLDSYTQKTETHQPQTVKELGAPFTSAAPSSIYNVFERVWPTIEELLETPRTEKEVAGLLVVQPAQARAWLEKAEALGRVTKLSRPTRYTLSDHDPSSSRS